MVNVGGEKMSKSLGNFTTIRQMLDHGLEPMVLRLFVLMAHYRKPIDFTDEAIASANNSWETLKEGLLFGYQYGAQLSWPDRQDPNFGNSANMRIDLQSDPVQRFQAAMDDDFNTSSGVAVLFELAKALGREGNLLVHQGKTEVDAQTLRAQWQTLLCLAQVLGLEATPESPVTDGLSDADIEAQIQQRQEARKAKNWAESDRIRDELKAQGITLVDQPGGITTWHRS